ncbi:hypothetical protein QVO10_06270 [Bacteroides gallinaceum]|uniref:Glycosyltransferase n=1 Tax=Bacteroides gallinaceum TaxID=1462571 RepID=A0ABT7X4J9_9BACE|nr:hypothetical protein [Bacteroides gallinaceum]MDN0048995.1 hypothetical protein [Bacteroides gallinaceum]
MTYELFTFKVKERIWRYIVKLTIKTPFYHYIFKSYWHYIFHEGKANENFTPTKEMYYGARPNRFAGIGHQMANWIDGYHWASLLGMKHMHMHFSNQKWEYFLDFGNGSTPIETLRKQKYKIRRLPFFSENNPTEIALVKKIMSTYVGEKVAFWPPQDHFYRDMYEVGKELRQRFDSSPARKDDHIEYDKNKFNIAIHVRRVVVIDGQVIKESPEQHERRWLANDYYEKVLKQVLENINPGKPIAIYIFSTGKPEEFAEFSKYGEVHFCSSMDEYRSFAHLIYADLLITSKSSFSYKPALMNTGIKVCPRNFWHGYPQNDPKWILCENDGSFDTHKLQALFKQ